VRKPREAGSKIKIKMSVHQELPVYKSTYNLLLGIFQLTKGFSKEYKYTVGEKLKKSY